MKTLKEVDALIAQMKAEGLPKPEFVRRLAEACLGWPYVFGAAGAKCTPSGRKSRANGATTPAAEAAVIRSGCRVLSGKASACAGCKWGAGARMYDCRGYTRWILNQAGLSLMGTGATSQWKDGSNWALKGEKKDLPEALVACVFMQSGSRMSHTGLHVGNGRILHCSGEVKEGRIADRGWSHFAIPKGLYDADLVLPEVSEPRPMLKKGSRGDAVRELQGMLLARGYDLGSCGMDGIFGKRTKAAVKAFQKDCGIKVDGIVGPVTWGCLAASVQ